MTGVQTCALPICIGDYDYEQEMDDLNFIFDEAVEAQKDLVIMVY